MSLFNIVVVHVKSKLVLTLRSDALLTFALWRCMSEIYVLRREFFTIEVAVKNFTVLDGL